MSATQDRRTSGFWEHRTGWSRLKQLLFLEPLPGGARWSAAFGSLLLFVFALQVITGILLSMSYAPSVDTAWPSVRYIQEEVPLGGFIRGIHHWGSGAMVILLLFHLVQVFVWGAYKKPRELTWMVGVLLLVCVLGLAFTGYLLPWDQKAYWATRVGLGIASTTPFIGEDLRVLLQGGSQMGNLTLTRFFTLHAFLLPGLVVLLIVVHLYLFRLHGVTPPWWHSEEQLKDHEEPFWPRQVLMDAVFALAFLVGLGLWVHLNPAPLEAQADPSQSYEARPEWYFMFFFQLLRYFEGEREVLGTFVLPTLFFAILFFWPLLDRNPSRDPRRRPLAMGLLAGCTAGLIGLTVFAVSTDVRMQEPATAARPARHEGPIQRADVAKLYNANCAMCHSVDGSGSLVRAAMPTIPDFRSIAWQQSQTELEITHRIREGNEPVMPAYRDKLSPQQMFALTVYIRAFAGPPAEPAPGVKEKEPNGKAKGPPVNPPEVVAHMKPLEIYRVYCMGCHDADGAGNTFRKLAPELPDLTNAKWQASRTDADLLHAILEGKGKIMVPMKDKLGRADAEQMVAFVRGFKESKQVVPLEPQPSMIPTPPTEPTIVVPSVKPFPVPPPVLTGPSPELAARMRVAAGLYRQYCLLCHGANGTGQELRSGMPKIPDFASPAWQDEVPTPRLAASILDGKGALMPAFRGRVTPEQSRDLAAYVRAFGPKRAAPSEPTRSDFERSFRDLERQWDELQRQLREMAVPPKK
jgi:quinol-cytochrome oxidoreductase complex cytochrome b subunit/mono/diheme cytochrome c family protein